MLEPQKRLQLLGSLRPPVGYELDGAIGTTFSLDLLAALTAPLAFTFFSWEDSDGRLTKDQHTLLAAVKRSANRIAIFCQAGQISVPSGPNLLHSFLEESVVAVSAPAAMGVFHPKVWVLRYTAKDEPVHYRMLCLSRNLTFDRSWDTILVLDGKLQNRTNAYARNRPLSEFVGALPGLAVRAAPAHVRKLARTMKAEILTVDFELPEGFQDVGFFPLGLDGTASWPFDGRVDRMLVISPFLSTSCLKRLAELGSDNVLISRIEALQSLAPAQRAQFSRVYCMNPDAHVEPTGADEPAIVSESGGQPLPAETPLVEDVALAGLHAKLYVAESGRYASVWTGSANATEAAFNRNVEFLTCLTGLKNRFGIDALLKQEKGSTHLLDLLVEFQVEQLLVAPDAVLERLKQTVHKAVMAIGKYPLRAKVAPSLEAGQYSVALEAAGKQLLTLPPAVQVRCWPITLLRGAGLPFRAGDQTAVRFERLSLEAVTGFFAFEVQAAAGGQLEQRCFVCNLELVGAPAERRDCILKALLRNRDEVMRFLLLLLFEPQDGESGDGAGTAGYLGAWQSGTAAPTTLFETLLRALDRAPERLKDVAQLIADLGQGTDGDGRLPEGFSQIWPAILAVLEES